MSPISSLWKHSGQPARRHRAPAQWPRKTAAADLQPDAPERIPAL